MPGRCWAGPGDGRGQVGGHQRRQIPVLVVGRSAGEQFVQDTGEGVHVAAVVYRGIRKSFRSNVIEGANGFSRLGEPGGAGGAGQPEIDQAGEVVSGEQDVRGFDVAVQHRFGVRGIQGCGDLAYQAHRARRIERPVTFEQRLQIHAADQPHVDVNLAVDLPAAVDRQHMRLAQPARGTGLPEQALTEHRV